MLPLLGALVGAGASLAGSAMNASAAASTNAATLADKDKDRELQKEFAQSGIQWKVRDAEKAGIHPIYALGGSTASYTPSAISLSTPDIGGGLASAGQDIGRAIGATATQKERDSAYTVATQKLSLERAGLENELLKSQIARARQTPNPPMPAATPSGNGFLVEGQGQTANLVPRAVANVPAFQDKSENRIPSGHLPQAEGGAIPDIGFVRTGSGWAPVPGKDVKERIEDNVFQEGMHFFRNNVLPTFGVNRSPPFPAPAGKRWVYHGIKQEYQLIDKGSRNWKWGPFEYRED